jgi:hypothetical protein
MLCPLCRDEHGVLGEPFARGNTSKGKAWCGGFGMRRAQRGGHRLGVLVFHEGGHGET